MRSEGHARLDRRTSKCSPTFVLRLVAPAAVSLVAGCSLDWSHVDGDDVDGPADLDVSDVPHDVDVDSMEDAGPDADGDFSADADADADAEADADAADGDSSGETDGACGDAGGCVDDGDPCNGTEYCHPFSSTCQRRDPLLDGSPCAGGTGRCCDLTCRLGGNCCTGADCPMACGGEALPCATYAAGATCIAQEGCRNSPGTCSTTSARDCGYVPEAYCDECGCTWDPSGGGACVGTTLVGCFGLDEVLCTNCNGCLWNSGLPSCIGEPTACYLLPSETRCRNQGGCTWRRQSCNGSWVCV